MWIFLEVEMWKVGDRIKRSSPIHGDMIGTIDAVMAGINQTIYHVTWETSKTGTIQSKEVGGRDDRNWEPLQREEGQASAIKDKVSPSAVIAGAIAQASSLTSEHTRRAYRGDLARYENWAGGAPLSRARVGEYIRTLEDQGKSPGRINRTLAAIRWWARQKMDNAVAAEHMPPATMIQTLTEMIAITRIPDRPLPVSRKIPSMPAEEFDRLIAACRHDPSPAGARDEALFSFARFLRLKPGSLLRLQRSDLTTSDPEKLFLQDPSPRGNPEFHPLNVTASAAARAWIIIRDEVYPPSERDRPLFLAINKGGRIQATGLSGEALRQVLKKRLRQVGLNNRTWHQLRGGT